MRLKYILALGLAFFMILAPCVGAEEQPTEETQEYINPYANLTFEQWQSFSPAEKMYIIWYATYNTCENAVRWTYSKTEDKLNEYSYNFYEFVKDPEGQLVQLMYMFPTDDAPYTVNTEQFAAWFQEHHGGGGYSGGEHGGGGSGGARPDPADVSNYQNSERQNEYMNVLLGFHTGETSIDFGNGFVFKEKHRVIDISTGDEIGDSFDTPTSIRVEKGLDIYFNGNWVDEKWYQVYSSGSNLNKFNLIDTCGGFKQVGTAIYYDASIKYNYYTWKQQPDTWTSTPDQLAASQTLRLFDVTTYIAYNDQDYSQLPSFTPLVIDPTQPDYNGQYGFGEEDEPTDGEKKIVDQNNEIIGWLKKIYQRQQDQQVAIIAEIARGNNLLSTLNNTINNQFNRLYNLLNKPSGSGNTTNNEGDENNLNLDLDLSLFDDLISIATEIKSAESTEDNSIKVTFYNQKKELFRKLGVPQIVTNINKFSQAFFNSNIVEYSGTGEGENPTFTMNSSSGASTGSIPNMQFTVFGTTCNVTEYWYTCIDPIMPTVREIFSFFIILGVIMMYWKALPGIIGNVGYVMGFSSEPTSDPDPVGTHEKPHFMAVDDDGEVRELNRIGSIFGKSTWQFKR